MKKIGYLIVLSIALFFNTVHGQITVTGKEHLLNNYGEAVGKNVTFILNDEDIDNLFVIKDDKMKSITKVFDRIEINGFIKGSKTWMVHGIITHKKKNYLNISQKNINLYIWIDKKDFVSKMRYFNVYDNLIDILNSQNIYLKKSVLPTTLFSKYLLCDTAYYIKWTGYELLNDTVYFNYSYIDKDKSLSNTYGVYASIITQDKFVSKNIVDECLLLEQNVKDSLEDEKLHAFLIYQKNQDEGDTVFLFNPVQGWHHNSICTVISTSSNEITLFAPDSTYSQISYNEYLDYVKRRGYNGEELRKGLAKYADSVNSVGFMLHLQQLQKEREKEKELAAQNNPLIAKPRVNEEQRGFLAKSATITNLKQWFYDNGAGKWIIRKPYTGDGRCKSLQLCSFLQNGEIYYTLKCTIASGEYRYPALGIDFIPYNEYYLYTFDKDNIEYLRNPNELASWVYSKEWHYDNYQETNTDNEVVRCLGFDKSPRGYI